MPEQQWKVSLWEKGREREIRDANIQPLTTTTTTTITKEKTCRANTLQYTPRIFHSFQTMLLYYLPFHCPLVILLCDFKWIQNGDEYERQMGKSIISIGFFFFWSPSFGIHYYYHHQMLLVFIYSLNSLQTHTKKKYDLWCVRACCYVEFVNSS